MVSKFTHDNFMVHFLSNQFCVSVCFAKFVALVLFLTSALLPVKLQVKQFHTHVMLSAFTQQVCSHNVHIYFYITFWLPQWRGVVGYNIIFIICCFQFDTGGELYHRMLKQKKEFGMSLIIVSFLQSRPPLPTSSTSTLLQ